MSPASAEYLTLQDLAIRWRTNEKWIYSNHRRLRIPSLKLGRQLRFRRDFIERWERQNHRHIAELELKI